MLLQRTLQRAGYEVAAVEDGCRALAELSKEDPPRLALLDWIMPEWTHRSVPRSTPAKDHAYTYLILLSSRETKQGHRARAGVRRGRYLTKPYDAEELKARLRAGSASWNWRIAWWKRARA